MAENINVTLQKLANSSAKSIQDSVNKANMEGLKFNAKEAATARKWQENMSKSSHQMEVADLKKAGLNPVLSANSGGAQSYTTSAASGSVDSGANAYGSVMSGLMSTLAGLKQSEMSAAAQRYSADRSYHAAELSAQAQRYAAEMSASAQKYSADMSYKTAMDKPQSSITGLLDKHFGQQVKGNASKFYNSVKSKINGFDKDNLKGLKQGSFSLSNKRGDIDDCRSILNSFGIDLNSLTGSNRKRAARALYDLQFSKTAPGAINTLKALKKN